MNLAVDPGFPEEREAIYGFAKFHRELHANKANLTGEGVATASKILLCRSAPATPTPPSMSDPVADPGFSPGGAPTPKIAIIQEVVAEENRPHVHALLPQSLASPP